LAQGAEWNGKEIRRYTMPYGGWARNEVKGGNKQNSNRVADYRYL
jgi:hypothetical protein